MRERVRGYADAIFGTSAGQVAKVADELRGFSELLAGSPDLAWAIAGAVTPLPTKRTIIQQLLAHHHSLRRIRAGQVNPAYIGGYQHLFCRHRNFFHAKRQDPRFRAEDENFRDGRESCRFDL